MGLTMTELEKLLAGEKAFQRNAVVVALMLLSAASMTLSVARAVYNPADQLAAAVGPVEPAGQPIAGAVAQFGSFSPRPASRFIPAGRLPQGPVSGNAPLAATSPLADAGAAPASGDLLPAGPAPIPGGLPAGNALAGGGSPAGGFNGLPSFGGLGPGNVTALQNPVDPDPEGPTGPGVSPTDPAGPGTNPVDPGDPQNPVSPVPEPTTWMMMILGVGLVGAALRRSRQAQLSHAAMPAA